MLIAHFSIVFLIAAGFVSFHWKNEGNMALYEGEESSAFQSYHDWGLEVREADENAEKVYVVDQKFFVDLEPGKQREFTFETLPFVVDLTGYFANCEPRKGGHEGLDEDGYHLQELEKETENERNVPGMLAKVSTTSGEEIDSGLLWGIMAEPWTVKVGESQYSLRLKRRTWDLPFSVKLNNFEKVDTPGIQQAAEFKSYVSKTQDGNAEDVKIYMNHPMRREGYVFFQASWGPETAKPGDPVYSVLAVVQNPSDMWPLYSCIAVGVGLAIHFFQKIFFLNRRTIRKRQRELEAEEATS